MLILASNSALKTGFILNLDNPYQGPQNAATVHRNNRNLHWSTWYADMNFIASIMKWMHEPKINFSIYMSLQQYPQAVHWCRCNAFRTDLIMILASRCDLSPVLKYLCNLDTFCTDNFSL